MYWWEGPVCSYSLLRVTHHTVLRNSAFEKGKDRALDLLPQKTVARLEVLRPVPCKFLETRLVKPVVIWAFRMPASIKTHFFWISRWQATKCGSGWFRKNNNKIGIKIWSDIFGCFWWIRCSGRSHKYFFLQNLSCCLNPGGWLVGNLWTITGDFIERRVQWQSTFNQLFQARANEKGNIILYASQNSKVPEKQSLKHISKNLQKHHQLDFHKMLRKLEAA